METLRNKVRTKKNSYWTLVVIPASQEKVNNFKLPCWLLRGILVFAAIGMLSVLYFFSSYRLMQEEIAAMAGLKVVNQLQEEEIARLKNHATEMEQKIQTVQKLDRQVRDLVGLKRKRLLIRLAAFHPVQPKGVALPKGKPASTFWV